MPPEAPKAGAPKELLLADLGGTPLTAEELAAIPGLAGIKKDIWSKFPGAIARKEFRAGEVIFRQGDSGTTAFYLVSGTVQMSLARAAELAAKPVKQASGGWARNIGRLGAYLKGTPASHAAAPLRTHIPVDGPVDVPIDNPMAMLEEGEVFGELSALAALKQEKLKRPKFYPRASTAHAVTDAVVLEMLPNILNNVLYNAPAFKDKLNRNYRDRALETHLRSVPMFANLSPEFLSMLRERAELVDVIPGQQICGQGENADSFYLIRMGFVKVSQQFPGGELVLAYISRGSYFGEIGLLPPVFRLQARNTRTGRELRTVVSRDPVTVGRDPSGEDAFRVTGDDYISRDHFRIHGEQQRARVTRLNTGKNPLRYKDESLDTFALSAGESFLLGDTLFTLLDDTYPSGRRVATYTAMDFCQLVRIKAGDFAQLLEQYPDVEGAIHQVARSRRELYTQTLNRVSTVSLDEFLDQELMQGQNLLLIDLDRCTRCDECSKACAATHADGVPRILREGLRFDQYLVPTSCRACLDPLCMTRCPVGSIRRKQTLDIVIEDWCIGCGNCAIDCPYGNINVVRLPFSTDQHGGTARPKATVCDLCNGYEEPNCVRACPHDAAIRVDAARFFARDLAGVQLNVAGETQAAPAEAGALLQETRIHTNIASLLPLLPRLRVRSGLQADALLQLRFPTTLLGRADDCDYHFEDDGISRAHCSITAERGRFVVRDLQSTNGTLVNGQPVMEMELHNGDLISIGEVDLEFLTGRMS
ncbi:MAG: cyclic nucleotide-binding domain-containing protein [Candidatus Solibacter usitatus]|nr:cyclic nucleotide-binding domain-containing protein [Candidatus Solibacter usitatus]